MTNPRVLAINGSYRDNGITDQVLGVARKSLEDTGVAVDMLTSRDENMVRAASCV